MQRDRNLCAHPSVSRFAAPFSPSAELARYHLRNVVEHMCQHPPTQGKSGFDELWTFIESQSFPGDWEKAKQQLLESPYQHMRGSTRKNFVISLVKTPIKEKKSYRDSKKIYAALRAAIEIRPEVFEGETISKINTFFQSLNDDERTRSIVALQEVPRLTQILNSNEIEKIRILLSSFDPSEKAAIISCAAGVTSLHETAIPLVNQMDIDGLATLMQLNPGFFSCSKAIDFLEKVKSFDRADSAMDRLIIPNAKQFSLAQIEDILRAAQTNNQIYSACSNMPDYFKEFFLEVCESHDNLCETWLNFRQFIMSTKDARYWISLTNEIKNKYNFIDNF